MNKDSGMIPTIIVHGGAASIPDSRAEASMEGVKRATLAGLRVMTAGGTAVDAVQAAVCVLEDDSTFNAGTGSTLNLDGEVEMDAVIMDGRDLSAGSVACVRNIAHPINLARLVMDKTDHVLLVGEGASRLASQFGVEYVPIEKLVTEMARDNWKRTSNFKSSVSSSFNKKDTSNHDTVGAAAVDKDGHVAFGTSTGGITAKLPGRVGDSPIIGSGGYADDHIGAASTTGHGEGIMKVCLARHVLTLMEQGHNPQKAAEKGLTYMLERVGSYGGIIVVNNSGQIGAAFTTKQMAWAWATPTEVHYGLNPQENFKQKLPIDE